jgi:hypothetical protein
MCTKIQLSWLIGGVTRAERETVGGTKKARYLNIIECFHAESKLLSKNP